MEKPFRNKKYIENLITEMTFGKKSLLSQSFKEYLQNKEILIEM